MPVLMDEQLPPIPADVRLRYGRMLYMLLTSQSPSLLYAEPRAWERLERTTREHYCNVAATMLEHYLQDLLPVIRKSVANTALRVLRVLNEVNDVPD